MAAEKLNLDLLNIASIKSEIDTGINVLDGALGVAEKLADFVSPTLAAELQAAINGLNSVKTIIDKI